VQRAQRPTHRPTWLVVLSTLMLLAGGYALVQGMVRISQPATVLRIGAGATADSPAERDLRKQLMAARSAAVATRTSAIRIEAVAQVLVALLTLYATAALLAHDRHGRTLTLAAATLAILYQLGTLPGDLDLASDFAERTAPLLAALPPVGGVAGERSQPPATREDIALVLTFWHLLTAGVGIAGSLVLLTFFGGRRGRALYGILPIGGGAPSGQRGSGS
jgi:hypothetical protein